MLLGSQLAFQMCKEKEASLFSTSDRIFLTSSHPARKLMEAKGEVQQALILNLSLNDVSGPLGYIVSLG